MHLHDSIHLHRDPNFSDIMMLENRQASRVLLISFFILFLTALLQTIVVYFTQSAGLLADTIHNYADALSSVPLWAAFLLSRRPPTRRFQYGFDRVEDLMGFLLTLMILASGVYVLYEALQRMLHPLALSHHLWGILAACTGFAGNEAVAIYKIRTGRKIDSASLIADGKHARGDGLTSLAAGVGILASYLTLHWIDAVSGALISIFILIMAYRTGKDLAIRLVDGVHPELYEKLLHLCGHHPAVHGVYDIRARWCGRKILAELTLSLDPNLDLQHAHAVAEEVRHSLLHEIKRLDDVTVHFDPAGIEQAHELTAHHFKMKKQESKTEEA